MKNDNPGIKIPPPLIYAAIFFAAIFFQKKIPINNSLFKNRAVHFLSLLFFITAVFFASRSLRQFIKTKNTVITSKPANSLQTAGIYNTSRNPMYIGLLCVYLGFTCLLGNWWNVIFFPILVIIVQEYIIKREEQYLVREFGKEYEGYQQKVKRWL